MEQTNLTSLWRVSQSVSRLLLLVVRYLDGWMDRSSHDGFIMTSFVALRCHYYFVVCIDRACCGTDDDDDDDRGRVRT